MLKFFDLMTAIITLFKIIKLDSAALSGTVYTCKI